MRRCPGCAEKICAWKNSRMRSTSSSLSMSSVEGWRVYKRPFGRLSVSLLFFGRILTGFVQATAAAPPPSVSTAGVTLAECFQRARQISETIGISAENYRLVQEQYRAQVGSILPHIDWIKT